MEVLIAGDFCPQERVAVKFRERNFSDVLGYVKEKISKVDYSIVNYECPIICGGEKAIKKCGPNLKCSRDGLDALKWAGFDAVTLANNHFYDFGDKGVVNTVKACSEIGIDYVGGGRNITEASDILYKCINDEVLSVINCCEHEFSIATEFTGGSNPLNPIKQFYEIQEASKKSDYVVVIVHGGNEYYQLPSPRMKELYRFFIDCGADCVINHHQHCFSGYEVYKEKPIFYGLGNFCFDDHTYTAKSWFEGYMVDVFFHNKSVKFQLIPYTQCHITPQILLKEGKERKLFDSEIDKLNKIIDDDRRLYEEYEFYLDEKKDSIRTLFLPIANKLTIKLCRRHLLPNFVSKNNKYNILNFLMCESHLPKFIKYIKDL